MFLVAHDMIGHLIFIETHDLIFQEQFESICLLKANKVAFKASLSHINPTVIKCVERRFACVMT